jgi:hypothetical protein
VGSILTRHITASGVADFAHPVFSGGGLCSAQKAVAVGFATFIPLHYFLGEGSPATQRFQSLGEAVFTYVSIAHVRSLSGKLSGPASLVGQKNSEQAMMGQVRRTRSLKGRV